MKHTPGPWHCGIEKACVLVYAPDGYAIADAKTYHGHRTDDETRANALLLASAPDLLAFAKLFLAYHDNETADEVTIETLEAAARAAVAKAVMR